VQELEQLDVRESKKRKKEVALIVLLAIVFLFLTFAEFELSRASSTLPFVTSIFFFGLLNVNIILLIGLMWLIFRNVGKLFIERRSKLWGARLKTKLVIAFFSFSIIPTLVLFVISAMYIHSSFDQWFSLKIQNTLQASLEITGTYYRNGERMGMHFAKHIAQKLQNRFEKNRGWYPWITHVLEMERSLLDLDSVEFYPHPLEERISAMEMTQEPFRVYPRLSLDLLDQAFSNHSVSVVQHVGSGDLIRCLVPVISRKKVLAVLAVNSYVPLSLLNKVDEISSVFHDYQETNPLKYSIKTTYLVILIMITLVILFVAIWIGLYMAKELTDPIERLVLGAQAVGGGNLDVSISSAGYDEISVLVDSFNNMTQDLRESREHLIQAGADLEKRRLQLEAVLANVETGVIAVDRSGELTTFNRAVSELFQIEPEAVLNQHYTRCLDGQKAPLIGLIDQAFALGHDVSQAHESIQWIFQQEDQWKTLVAVATSLRQGEGVVVVIDDVTHLMKEQREMAWREVARRIAHEIKNPLTPIKLSAQRLQRRCAALSDSDTKLLQECTETIIRYTDELKEMVNEFSNFARFPESSPAPHALIPVLEEVVALYRQAHPEIAIQTQFDEKVPVFAFDRDQIKRVMINLFDNAVAALEKQVSWKVIRLQLHYDESLQMVAITMEDNGPGMDESVKRRLFEPYFSMKEGGTGLGLAIVKRILNDHSGFIRVKSKLGEGTQFLIELPAGPLKDFLVR
jgi:two-component system nitrogen regulation sensor histidine kinase NtrY